MNIPNFIDANIVDKSGNLTPTWKQIFINLFSELQGKASDDGIVAPPHTNSTIPIISSEEKQGAIVYNTDTHKLMINENGVYKTVTTT